MEEIAGSQRARFGVLDCADGVIPARMAYTLSEHWECTIAYMLA